MSSNRSSAAAAVRARLNHPVIDSDGHWVEFGHRWPTTSGR